MRFANIFAAAAIVSATFGMGTSANAQEDAKLRVAHFSPDAPAVDVYLDGAKKFAQVKFPLMSAYTPVPSGKHTIEMRTAGGAATDKPLIALTTDLAGGKSYLLAATGPAASLALTQFNDDLTPPPPGKTRLRIINAVVGGAAIDADANASNLLATNLAVNAASPYQELDATKYDLSIRASGKPDVLVSKTITLQGGAAYTIAAIGNSPTVNLRGFADVSPSGAATGGAADPTGADGSKVPATATSSAAALPVTTAQATAPVPAAPVPVPLPAPVPLPTPAPTTKALVTAPPKTSAAPQTTVPIGGTNNTTETKSTTADVQSNSNTGGTTVDIPTAGTGSPTGNTTPTSGVATGFGGMSDANSALVVFAMAGLAGLFVLMGLKRRQSAN